MKKLFITNDSSPYVSELMEAFSRATGDKIQCSEKEISSDFISKNKTDVVVCNGLSKDQSMMLKGLEVPIITIGNSEEFANQSDLVIDFKAEDDKRYFTGSSAKIKDNYDFRIDKIVNLVEKLEWDSQFFGFNVAYVSCMQLTENIMKKVRSFVESENIRLVEYLCNCHNAESVRLAESFGFNFVDVRLVFRKKVETVMESNFQSSYTVRKATPSDHSSLIPIARESYVDSRYYFDNHFPKERCQQFYEDWLKKSINGSFDDIVYAVCDQDKPIGFISAKKQTKQLGKIGLVGVDKNYQGKGVGKVLINQFFKWAQSEQLSFVDVVTQGRNYSAQKLYQSMGFRTKLVQLWYHKWIY